MYRQRLVHFFTLLAFVLAGARAAKSQPRQYQFEQFPVQVFKGRIQTPKGVHKESTGEWRDENGKMINDLAVNFAGEYWLIAHSCGTGCRGYSLLNLRTGADVHAIRMFDSGEPRPVTSDGHPYLTVLYTRRDSRLLIAEYHLDFGDPNRQETCRQRYYLLEGHHLRPLSKTFPFCTEEVQR
jgi:hypothetical protein